ncbi:uncharacterized protein (TIGR02453 family) [Crossiella cryophila]|uniref:Uncharacterized protein (TIGR02453 family) n=2 Tax=Crossiella cryophila TaxID=43355 RepID=A0A7W7FXU7_9PSEU|nr:uncharacterized protein (TIGR02453 family) [Crossiella cryophila]
MMGFTGFGEHAVDFYDGLEADNSKAYWTDHKDTYDQDVRAPMLAMLAELEEEFGAGKLFRPYRDVRFSHDKSPYKTAAGALAGGELGESTYYVQISANGLMLAGGCYRLATDQVARYRTAVAEDRRGGELVKVLAKLTKAGWSVQGDVMKTRPRGVEADHPRLDLLRHRSLHASRAWEPGDYLHERECLTRVRKHWRALAPLTAWLADHVGPPSG